MRDKIEKYFQKYFKDFAINSLKLQRGKRAEILSKVLTGTVVLEELNSPVNGEVKVIKSLAFGTYIQAGNLTQSGGILYDVWKKPLKKVKSQKSKVKNCLVLGLGGGTVIKLIKKYWPDTKITGVDIDPIMVELGKKHLGLDEKNIKIVIDDAYDYLNQNSKLKSQNKKSKIKSYDLMLIDLYVGDEYPEKFESENYILLVRRLLARDGIAIFNRLYYGEKRSKAVKFLGKLEKNFSKVDVVYPQANVMYICHL